MDSNTVFAQLKEYWFNNQCDNKFYSILDDKDLSAIEKEVKSLDYIRDTFKDFAEKNNYNTLEKPIIEIILNWGILMYLQIKDKLYGNEETT